MIRRSVLPATAAFLLLFIEPASAQYGIFVKAAQTLADVSAQKEPGRLAAIRAAADRMAQALREWDRGIAALEAAPAPHNYQQHVELGVAYRTRGRLADALRELDAAAALQSSASDVHVLRALTLEAADRPDAAGAAFLTAWTRDRSSPVKAYYVATRPGVDADERARARTFLADTYRRLPAAPGQPASAPFLMLDAIPDNLSPAPVVGDEATAEGFALLASRRYTEGVAALKNAATRAADAPSSHFVRAQRAEGENHVAEARREYQIALAGTLSGRSVLLVAIARLAQVEGDSAGATEVLNQAARLVPNDVNVRRELAAVYADQGHTDEAFCELMAALLVDPRDAQAHAAIGRLYLDAGRPADAVAAFTRALDLAPDRYEIRYALAMAQTRLGHSAEAERQLEIFDRLRRDALDKRRRDIANEVDREERSR